VGRIHEELKQAVIISIYKKGDKSRCTNDTGISLINSVYKIYVSILKAKLQPTAENILIKEECGFRKGRSCTNAVFTIKQIIEKRRECNLPLFLLFLDYEKAYERVNRSKLWSTLGRYKLPVNLLNNIKSLYNNTSITIKIGNRTVNGTPFVVNEGYDEAVDSPHCCSICI
jgi:sorting nexin-29